MAFTALHISDPLFSELLWKQLFELYCAIRDRYRSQMVASSPDSLKKLLLAQVQSSEKNYYFAIVEDERPVGWISLRIDRDGQSRTIGNMFSEHLYDSIPQGFSSTAASELMRIMRETDCREIVCEAASPGAGLVSESLGGRKMAQLHRYRLYRKKANMEIIDGWLEFFPKEYPDHSVAFFYELPDDLAQAYVELMNQCIQDIPAEQQGPVLQLTLPIIRSREAARRKRQMRYYTVAILDNGGRMMGHSNASIFQQNPTGGYQSMTGVARDYRGYGFSKWLKAELFTRVGKLHPDNEYLNVDMRSVNEPILKVNRAMGYELFYRGHEYLIEPESLRRVAQGQ